LFDYNNNDLESGGFSINYPEGRGIFYNQDKSVIISVNDDDHIKIISVQYNTDLVGSFSKAILASQIIAKKTTYAHSDNLGYITASPTHLGTGLNA
jgi:arginine kinase